MNLFISDNTEFKNKAADIIDMHIDTVDTSVVQFVKDCLDADTVINLADFSVSLAYILLQIFGDQETFMHTVYDDEQYQKWSTFKNYIRQTGNPDRTFERFMYYVNQEAKWYPDEFVEYKWVPEYNPHPDYFSVLPYHDRSECAFIQSPAFNQNQLSSIQKSMYTPIPMALSKGGIKSSLCFLVHSSVQDCGNLYVTGKTKPYPNVDARFIRGGIAFVPVSRMHPDSKIGTILPKDIVNSLGYPIKE